ncbi:hypothetical protein, partial [Rhodococcus jostii]|uniref:hypothetical protein n=1 Tax=Rhodococcus jostii TaxID=132919 RepID=UPI0036516208
MRTPLELEQQKEKLAARFEGECSKLSIIDKNSAHIIVVLTVRLVDEGVEHVSTPFREPGKPR